MSWNYAELSKRAKEVGGPEQLVNVLIDSGKATGRKEMVPVSIAMLLLGSVLKWAYDVISEKCKQNELVAAKKVETAKEEYLKGIRDYDAITESGASEMEADD